MKEIHEVVGEYVSLKRKEKGVTCTQFSKEVGVARSTIFNIEKKVGTCVSLWGMNNILKALGVTWKDLAEVLDNNNQQKGVSHDGQSTREA